MDCVEDAHANQGSQSARLGNQRAVPRASIACVRARMPQVSDEAAPFPTLAGTGSALPHGRRVRQFGCHSRRSLSRRPPWRRNLAAAPAEISSTSSDGRHRRTPFGRDDEGPVDQDRLLQHRIEKLVVAQRRIVEAELGIGRSLSRLSAARTVRPALLIRSLRTANVSAGSSGIR